MELADHPPCTENHDLAQRLAAFMLVRSGAMEASLDDVVLESKAQESANYLRSFKVAGLIGGKAANILSGKAVPDPVLACAARQALGICPTACREVIGDTFSAWQRQS